MKLQLSQLEFFCTEYEIVTVGCDVIMVRKILLEDRDRLHVDC